MKVQYNEKQNFSSFTLEEEDLRQARKISGLLQSEEWKILLQYWILNREVILNRLLQPASTNAETIKTEFRKGVMYGFNEVLSIPEKIIQRAEDYFKTKEEENKNAEPHTFGETEE